MIILANLIIKFSTFSPLTYDLSLVFFIKQSFLIAKVFAITFVVGTNLNYFGQFFVLWVSLWHLLQYFNTSSIGSGETSNFFFALSFLYSLNNLSISEDKKVFFYFPFFLWIILLRNLFFATIDFLIFLIGGVIIYFYTLKLIFWFSSSKLNSS